jgi:hypothetical protein
MYELRIFNKTLEYSLGHFNFTVLDTQKSIFIPAGSRFYKRSIKTLWNKLKYFTIFTLN